MTKHISAGNNAGRTTQTAQVAQISAGDSLPHTTHPLTRRSFFKKTGALAGTIGTGLALSATGTGALSTLTGCVSTNTSNTNTNTQAGHAIKGGTICAGVAYSSSDFNPIGMSSALAIAANWHVLEGLYELDFRTYNTYNALAKAKPVKISDTQYEVTLRDGAKFSDGKEVTSADIVNAFERNMADDTYGPLLSFIQKVQAKNSKTTTFKLKYPFESLLENRLSLVKIFPSDVNEESLKTNPIGTGPWMYDCVNGEEGGTIDFRHNDNYNGSYSPTAGWMCWNVYKSDSDARVKALTKGTVHVIESVPDTSADTLTQAGNTVEYVDGFSQAFLMFNTQKAPFDDTRVRQAFFYAIDTEKLIANEMRGHANTVTSFLPSSHANYHKAANVYTYNPARARELLEEAEVENLTFTLKCNNNWVSCLSDQVKADLEAVDMKCNVEIGAIQWDALAPSANVLPYDVCLTPGDPSCFGNDPDLLMSWWYGDNVWTRGRTCWKSAKASRWSELSELMQSARTSTGTAQQEYWNKCFDLISEEVPLYPLFHRKIATAWNPKKIADFRPIGMTGLVFIGSSCAE